MGNVVLKQRRTNGAKRVLTAEWWGVRHMDTTISSHEDVQAYYRDIAKYGLIDREEEIRLYQEYERAMLNLTLTLFCFPSVRARFGYWLGEIKRKRLFITDVFVVYPDKKGRDYRSHKTPLLMSDFVRRQQHLRRLSRVLSEQRVARLDLGKPDPSLTSFSQWIVDYVTKLRFRLDKIDELLALAKLDCAAVNAYRLTGLSRRNRESLLRRAVRAQTMLMVVREKMIVSNLRLVIAIIKPYQYKTTLGAMDLISNGNSGLIKAVERYNYRHRARFSTYATYWIRQMLLRSMADEGYTIRRPAHVQTDIGIIHRAMDGARLSLADAKHVARLVGLPVGSTEGAIQAMNVTTISFEEIRNHDDRPYDVLEQIADENAVNPLEVALHGSLTQQIEAVLETLTQREAHIIRLRFGLIDGNPKNLEEIGQIYNLTRERIRQIEAKALKRLQLPSRARRLRPYL